MQSTLTPKELYFDMAGHVKYSTANKQTAEVRSSIPGQDTVQYVTDVDSGVLGGGPRCDAPPFGPTMKIF